MVLTYAVASRVRPGKHARSLMRSNYATETNEDMNVPTNLRYQFYINPLIYGKKKQQTNSPFDFIAN